tara:strand:+ start:20935 stop:21429 length:495 start_codon:yes stop_codon:yes gene_type:complete
MSNMTKFTMTAAALAALISAAPLAAQAQSNGVTNCDAPGGRQQAGALIGAVIGGLAGNAVAKNEPTLGAVVGAGAGAAAGSYIGCNQQRARANANAPYASSSYQYEANSYRATSNLRVRSGPGTSYRQVGSLRAGERFQATTSQGEWVQLSNGGWVSAHYVAAN